MLTVLVLLNLAVTGYLVYRLVIVKNEKLFVKMETPVSSDKPQLVRERPEDYIRKAETALKGGEIKQCTFLLRTGFRKYSEDPNIFQRYIRHLFEEFEATKAIESKEEIVKEAKDVIEIFSGRTSIKGLAILPPYIEKAEILQKKLNSMKDKELLEWNTKCLVRLEKIYSQLTDSEDEKELKLLFEKAGEEETRLKIDTFDDSMKRRYYDFKEKFESIAQRKGEMIRNRKYSQYNVEVVDKLNQLLKEFNENEKIYSKVEGNFSIVLKDFIASVNSNYLSSETLTYFNYVYGYIFGNVDEEMKFSITRTMTETEKDVME